MMRSRHVHPVVYALLLACLVLSACRPVQLPSPATALLQELHAPELGVRVGAAYQLGQLPQDAVRAVPALIAATRDPHADVRVVAAYALGKLGAGGTTGDTDRIVAALDNLLADDSAEVRFSTARALGLVGAPASSVTAHLQTLVDNDTEDVRAAALLALAKIGVPDSAIPSIVNALDHPSWYVRDAAAAALKTVPATAAPLLVASLGARTPAGTITTWRQASAIVALLPDLGAPALAALPQVFEPQRSKQAKALGTLALLEFGPQVTSVLTETAASSNTLSSRIAVAALGYTGMDALPTLLHALAAEDAGTRQRAVQALAQVGPAVTPTLIRLLADPQITSSDKVAAIYALTEIGQPLDLVLSSLTAAAQDAHSEPTVLSAIAHGLARLGPGAAPALAALHNMVSGQDPQVRADAAAALAAVAPGSPAVLATLLNLLRTDDHAAVQAAVASGLGSMGPVAEPAVPDLLAALQNPDPAISGNAAAALAHIAPSAAIAQAVTALLRQEEQTAVDNAIQALGLIGADAVPVLVAELQPLDQDSFCEQPAALAISSIGEAAAAPLALALASADDAVRLTSVSMLACMPEAAAAARPFLPALLSDSTPAKVRAAAALALASIPPDAAEMAKFVAGTLHAPELPTRCAAAASLVMLAGYTAAAVPALLAALDDPANDVPCEFAPTLFLPLPTEGPVYLLFTLNEGTPISPQIGLRRMLRAALATSGTSAQAAAGTLLETLKDPVLRLVAARAIAVAGPAAYSGLRALIVADNAAVTPAVAEALNGMGTDIRRAAIYALLYNEAARQDMQGDLLALAYDAETDPALRAMAATVLQEQGRDLSALWPSLGQVDPRSIVCPVWANMEIAAEPRFDIYAGYCLYNTNPTAPTIPAIALAACRLLGGCQ